MKNELSPGGMEGLQEAYIARHRDLNGDMSGRLEAQAYLNTSTAVYHGDIIGVGFIPKIYDMAALRFLDTVVNRTYTILEKNPRRFLEDESYRRLFGFSPLLERLICLPTGYPCTIPIMRMDIFLNEKTFGFKFCEFNTDGTSAMNEDREAGSALKRSEVYRGLERELKLASQELFDGWVDGFLEIYRTSEQAVDNPTVAIVDFTDSASMNEFIEFAHRFGRQGYRCIICDVMDLEYDHGVLYTQNILTDVLPGGRRADGGNDSSPTNKRVRIDAIYRRAVTGEIVAALEKDADVRKGAGALVSAIEDKAVCMIGGFMTHIAHCKPLFALLHHPATAAFLNTEENDFIREHIPYTALLRADTVDLEAIKAGKDDWIIKPEDGYASKGVHAGRDHDEADWANLIDKCSKQRYIVQSYCEQYATPNSRIVPVDSGFKPLFDDSESWLAAGTGYDPAKLDAWNNLTGLYAYNGRFGGLFVRAGRAGIIAGFAGGMTLAAMLGDYDPDAGLALRVASA
ncbi:MAG TPA: hypothetical protein DEB24_04145 [Coriobacteriia bacterium]|nr:hypothetical protein [Coriobacteriia bacterium]